ncbi:hypothetical protein I4U23_000099 [Adineta vaga]|nr:hypothetical protein I4U23_000099 [Adineta vaga]
MLCIAEEELNTDWISNPSYLTLAFSGCSSRHLFGLGKNERLFHCNESLKIISVHRLDDSFPDCYYKEDESVYINSTGTYTFNFTDRFECVTDKRMIPRLMIGSGICSDKSDKLYIGNCKKALDFGCQFIRGLYSSSIYYLFKENCNGVLHITFSIDNETDETNCEEWPVYRCDGHWDVSNGEDELNCHNTILSYITHKVFRCDVNEHYCGLRNGTISCLSKQYAGDGVVDCIGATDERTSSCNHTDVVGPFNCGWDICIPVMYLCNHMKLCNQPIENIFCPWMIHFTCAWQQFPCKNRTCIERSKQCDNIIDCEPNGEDEWFCDLNPPQITLVSLDKIIEYPSVIHAQNKMIHSTIHLTKPLRINYPSFKTGNSFDVWFCNRGILVTGRFLDITCFCPPSYYGRRCEYQAEFLLVTVRIDIPISLVSRQYQQNLILLVARLFLDDEVVHHEQIMHMPLMKQMFYLNYPRSSPKRRANWSVFLDAFSVTRNSVDFKTSWLFKVPFSFLPVNRLVLHLILKDQDICNTLKCIHGVCKKYLNSPHYAYCHCEDNWSGKNCNITTVCSCTADGRCLNHYHTSICICPLGRMGSKCQTLFDPCIDMKCQNGGTCLPLDERQFPKFICACDIGYYGTYCELIDAQINIHFSSSLADRVNGFSTVVFAHFLEQHHDSPGIMIVQNRVLHKQVQFNKPFHVLNNNQMYLSSFILLQIYFEPNKFDFYIAAIIKNSLTNITTTVYQSNRCPHVNELLLNRTIREFPPLKKVKYYQYACEVNNTIKCFYDEAYLCFCDKYLRPECLFFQQQTTQCTIDYCKNNGQCVQNNFNGIWDFGCVCGGCTYGSLCQLATSQYALSLDVILGQDIRENVSFRNQPFLIKLTLSVLIVMLSIGLDFGCGVYLFWLSIISQGGLSALVARFFYLLGTQIYDVQSRSTALWCCIILEYCLTCSVGKTYDMDSYSRYLNVRMARTVHSPTD